MRVDQAIRRVSRDMFLMWAVHLLLAGGVMVAMMVGSVTSMSPVLLAAIPCTLWVLLAFNGMREARNAMNWPGLIAAGRLEEAEKQIENAIRAFSLVRSVKLLSLHQLAVVKMAQRKWSDAVAISGAVLQIRTGKDESLTRAALLVMASASVQTGELPLAFQAIGRLRAMQLTLDEQLALLAAECAYMARIGAWSELLRGIDQKARLAELMPCLVAAQTQAYLLLAAKKSQRQDWADYLMGRVELLTEGAGEDGVPLRNRLISEEPLLAELWSERAPQEAVPSEKTI